MPFARHGWVGPKLEPVDSFAAIRDDWNRLAERTGALFGSCEFAESWWETHGAGRRLLIFADQPSREPTRVVVPVYQSSIRPLTVLRFVGHGPADELGPVCEPHARPAAAAALRQMLKTERGSLGLLVAERLPADQGWNEMLGGQLLRRERSPVLRGGGLGWEEWLATKSANFRGHARRGPRRLAHDHDLRFRLLTGGDELAAALDTLFDLHVARWGAAASSYMYRRRSSHEAFAVRAAAKGWLRLQLVEVDGRTVAAGLTYRLGGVEWLVQMGRDPSWSGYSVGSIMVLHQVRDALDDGVQVMRLGRGQRSFKDRLASEDAHVDTFAVGAGLLPGAVRASFEVATRAPSRVKRLVAERIDL